MNNTNRRAWIKNIAIIFLAVLLILTLFSNTILNHSLPEVSAQYAMYDTISSAIKLSGTVKANESYNVIFEEDAAEEGLTQTRKVVSVYVREGDTVEIGTPILALKGGASNELAAAEKELAEKQNAYDLAILNDKVSSLDSGSTMTQAEQRLSDLKEELADLRETYDKLAEAGDGTEALDEQIKAYEKQKADLTKEKADADGKIAELEGKIDSLAASLEDDFSDRSYADRYHEANGHYSELELRYLDLKQRAEAAKETWDELTASSEDMREIRAVCDEILSLEDQIREKNKFITRDMEDFVDSLKRTARAEALTDRSDIVVFPEDEESEEAAPAAYADSGDGTVLVTAYIRELTTDDFEELQKIILRANDWDDAEDRLTRSLRSMVGRYHAVDEAAEAEIEEFVDAVKENAKSHRRSMEDQAEVLDDLCIKQNNAYEKLRILGVDIRSIDSLAEYALSIGSGEAEDTYNELNTELTELEGEYNAAKTEAETLAKIVEYEKKLTEYEGRSASLQTELDRIGEILAPLEGTDGIDAFLKLIETKEREVASAETDLQKAQVSGELSSVTTKQEREKQLREIEELKAKIETYKNAPETTDVTAPIAGRIAEISFVPGNSVTSGNVVARIDVAEKGYVCEISVPTEEARKIQVGAACSITNSWWSNLEASVTEIRSDASSQGKNRIVVISVKGDVMENQTLNFTIGDRSQSYNTVLPNSAIREDSEGKFVLVVESKNTPLGVRYTAVRYQVEVTASDDTKSAVSGLMGGEFVITNASSPVSDGQQVRLAEN